MTRNAQPAHHAVIITAAHQALAGGEMRLTLQENALLMAAQEKTLGAN